LKRKDDQTTLPAASMQDIDAAGLYARDEKA
jgi:hypothetical protein